MQLESCAFWPVGSVVKVIHTAPVTEDSSLVCVRSEIKRGLARVSRAANNTIILSRVASAAHTQYIAFVHFV